MGSTVVEIISAKMSPPPETALKPEDKLDDLGIASLDVVEIIFDIEERFDIEVPYNANQTDGADFKTVGDVVTAVEELVAAKKSA